MPLYTVTKPIGTTNSEFEAYTRLLEAVGIDAANSPRVPEVGTNRRWLYAWKQKIEADRFAAELRRRTGDGSWVVNQFDHATAEYGPVAPLEIASVPESDGYMYYLTPVSRERVVAAYPGSKLPTGAHIQVSIHQDFLLGYGDERWMEIARHLTARNDAEIDQLGGVRVIVGENTVVFQRIPSAA